MVTFTLVFSLFARFPSEGIPYPLFSYCALLPWTFFATSLNRATQSLTNNSNLLTKVYFPRELLPLTSIVTASVDFAIASILFIGILIFYSVSLTLNLIFVVLILFIQILFTLGMALFLSALNVSFRDTIQAIPLILQVWMYASPIVYPVNIVPKGLLPLYMLNPMAGIIDSYRKVILHGLPPDPLYLSYVFLVAVMLFILSYRYFKRKEIFFADII
jgi:lipopolysaccharide transport system permease protein